MSERAASVLTGGAIAVLLGGLVVAAFAVPPSAPIARPVDVPALSVARAAPEARGLSRMRSEMDELAIAVPPGVGMDLGDVREAPEPAPEPTPEPTPVPTPVPTPRPTPRPTVRTPAPIVVSASTSDAERRMLVLMNASRAAGGLAPLALDAALSAAARAHSQVEAQVGYVYHDGPDGTARSRYVPVCGNGWYGENTGKVWNGNVDALHIEFMSEPWAPINHRTNIMDPNFTRVGVGAVQGADALYMTMAFCR